MAQSGNAVLRLRDRASFTLTNHGAIVPMPDPDPAFSEWVRLVCGGLAAMGIQVTETGYRARVSREPQQPYRLTIPR